MEPTSILSPFSARPDARARIAGNGKYPALSGTVDFYNRPPGTVVIASIWGLPYNPARCADNINALHIHEGSRCESGPNGAYAAAGGHFNPENCPHPAHAGDLPPLFSCRGYAWLGVYTERFTPKDIIGRTVIIHSKRDDFTSQPAGDAGDRIGCGVIERVR